MAKQPATASETHEKPKAASGNGAANNGAAAPASTAAALDPEVAKKIAAVRSHVRESFGKIVMAMMVIPRYRSQSLEDLQHLVLEPLINDRVAIAYPSDADSNALADIAGVAIWASVSEEVDAKIREQVKSGVFPVRLKPDEWKSGNINWLLDVIAPNSKATARVIANFRQVAKEGDLRLHPVVAKSLDPETLKKMGAQKFEAPAA
ncbi:toxin-activating lysine-acyltransferase [Rhodopseudomonas parapalustris]